MTRPSRLDRELVDRGLARSRTQAQDLISSGLVQLNGTIANKPAELVRPSDHLEAEPDRYVSRAAHKLLGALDDLSVRVDGRALDAGASTGGFTQVLLERGCQVVYAVDVGSDQFADSLRDDPRVVLWERTNLRELELRHVGGRPVDLVVADVSFISLVLLIERLAAVVSPAGQLLLMVKPQFEVGRELLGKGGVVRSPALHRQAVMSVIEAAERTGWFATGLAPSRLKGPAGNSEFFVLFGSTRPDIAPELDALPSPQRDDRHPPGLCCGR
ncbi:MAG: TlyA family RNA methyltransferase [Propionibacteriaceae bacterium]|nr:TlyA family RNA methyltransferase [Propionibacteriaceae bacterium]